MRWFGQRIVRCAGLVAIVVISSLVPVPPVGGAAQASGVVPTQWIVKQYSELLGRAPGTTEWGTRVQGYVASGCTAATLRALTTELATSVAFTTAYPATTPLQKAFRLNALIRAALNHEPNQNDWTAYLVPYRDGTRTWEQTITAVVGSGGFAANVVPLACSASTPDYGFGTPLFNPPLNQRELLGLSGSRTQAGLQADIDLVAANGGGSVELEPGEIVRITHERLIVRAGVTLRTAGQPTLAASSGMGRLVAAGPNATSCIVWITCNETGFVVVEAGAALRSVWVDTSGLSQLNHGIASIELAGSSAAAPTAVTGNKVAGLARDGVGIRTIGYSLNGQACTDAVVDGNLIVGYGTRNGFDGRGEARWADGIANGCEGAEVTANTLIDITDAAIVSYGTYNRAANLSRPQSSLIEGNTVVNAGTSAHVAYGLDAIDRCQPPVGFVSVPCLDQVLERDFTGSLVTGNLFWTGPRTHIDVGLMVGGGTRWGDHRIFGRGATVTNNASTTDTQVNIGISVLGMLASTVSGNWSTFALVDGSPRLTWGKCPQVAVLIGAAENASLSPGSQAHLTNDSADGCLTGESLTGAMDPVVVANGGATLATGSGAGPALIPFGFRAPGDLPETFWTTDWNKLVSTFRDIRRMGANVVRFKLQFHTYVGPPTAGHPDGTPKAAELDRLAQVIQLAEETGLWVDLTGLRIESDADTNTWYDQRTSDTARWASQAVFWRAVATKLKDESSVAWYDLMNEPVAPNVNRTTWCAGASGGFCFVQNLSLNPAGRSRVTIARQWMTQMVAAIRNGAGDSQHLISSGLTDFSGFTPLDVSDLQSFGLLHIYPHKDDPATPVDEYLKDVNYTKAAKPAGAPLVLDETGIVNSGDMWAFIRDSRPEASGWVSHYFDASPAELLVPPVDLNDLVRTDIYRRFVSHISIVRPNSAGTMQP